MVAFCPVEDRTHKGKPFPGLVGPTALKAENATWAKARTSTAASKITLLFLIMVISPHFFLEA
jgi:hypothetical protein